MELFKKVVSGLEPKLASNIITHIPKEQAEQLLTNVPEKVKLQIMDYLTYPANSVGQIMRTEYIAFQKDIKVRDAVEKIRDLSKKIMLVLLTKKSVRVSTDS